MRWVSTRVLPEPAPARMSSGPSPNSTASRCGGVRPASSSSTASACSSRGSTSSERRSMWGSAAIAANASARCGRSAGATVSDRMPLVDDIRSAAAWVAGRAHHVRVEEDAIGPYARALEPPAGGPSLDPELHLLDGPLEDRAAFFLTLDAGNFGSGLVPHAAQAAGALGVRHA